MALGRPLPQLVLDRIRRRQTLQLAQACNKHECSGTLEPQGKDAGDGNEAELGDERSWETLRGNLRSQRPRLTAEASPLCKALHACSRHPLLRSDISAHQRFN